MKNYRYMVVSLPLFLISANAYTLTINQPTNGELKCATANENPVIIPCKINWEPYEKLLIIAKPDDGYTLYEWRGNCSNTFPSADCFLNMDSNKVVSAGFEKVPMYNLTITQPTHGKIYCNGGTCKNQYPKGTKVSLSVITESGYEFVKWDGGYWGESSEHPIEVIISENKTYSAIIKKIATEEPPQSNSGGFDFGGSDGSGCDGGSGTFQQQIEYWNNDPEKAVTVGTIPKDLKDIYISLKSDEDVDIRLYDVNGKKIVHWPNGILYDYGKATTAYNGVTVEYSGYNGDGTGLGHEYIKITGETTCNLTMKAYGYKAGYAKVHYEWGGDTDDTSNNKTEQFVRDDIKEIVIDTKNNLVWQDNVEAKSVKKKWSVMYDTCVATGASSACQNVNGNTADYYCKSLNMGGYSDWRLPTIGELQSIVDNSQTTNPYIPTAFKNVATNYGYWSSTADSGSIYHAMMISFMFSDGMAHSFTKGTENYVRCVRDKK